MKATNFFTISEVIDIASIKWAKLKRHGNSRTSYSQPDTAPVSNSLLNGCCCKNATTPRIQRQSLPACLFQRLLKHSARAFKLLFFFFSSLNFKREPSGAQGICYMHQNSKVHLRTLHVGKFTLHFYPFIFPLVFTFLKSNYI